jgi:imidazole glycerol-phosphate synthase subunit HisH
MIIIIDYGMGNIGSILNMLKKIGAPARISSDPDEIRAAEKLILPGVGAFDTGMRQLNECGLVDLLNEKVLEQKTPVLGVCLGMHLLVKKSEEGVLPGLGWINGETVRFQFDNKQSGLKIPHMGWNDITIQRSDALLNDLEEEARFYFVHSYHLVCHDPADIIAVTHHGYEFPSIVQRGNIMGTQFHPEKSHRFGMQLYRNFVERV